MSKLLTLFLFLSWLSFSLSQAEDYHCSPTNPEIVKTSGGNLVIPRTSPDCSFIGSQQLTGLFTIRLDDLKLRAGDMINIRAPVSDKPVVLRAPLNTGYLVMGFKEPVIQFHLEKLSKDDSMIARFSQTDTFELDGDINNDFEITPIGLGNLTIKFHKSIPDLVHFEVVGAKISGSSVNHRLISTQETEIKIEFKFDNQVARIRTSPALSTCSGVYNDDKETSHQISGPVPKEQTAKYKCVNIFQTIQSSTAHYQADFKDFISLGDVEDNLLLEDGTPDGRVNVVESTASSYCKRILTFDGQNLVVIYQNSRISNSSQIPFKLTVESKASGGVLKTPDSLKLSATNQLRYELRPGAQQYASIVIPESTKLSGASLTISSRGRFIALFSDGSTLPPVIALDEPESPMELEFLGKSLSKLNNIINFKPLTQRSCHRITSESFGGISLNKIKDTCYWTIVPTGPIALRLDSAELQPSGCLKIQSLLQSQPLYKKCNISASEVLPPFNLNQAFVVITLGEDSDYFNASFSSVPSLSQVNVEPKATEDITSFGYPTSYAYYSSDSKYNLAATEKSYVLAVKDIDIRDGEKLLVDNVEVYSSDRKKQPADVIIVNKTSSITLRREKPTTDISLRRGYSLRLVQYDKIFDSNSSPTPLVVPKNTTGCLVKLSSPGKDASKFGKRVKFNVTLPNSNDYNISIHDGRSILSNRINNQYAISNGTSTADTLMISYTPVKPGTKIPGITIDYTFVDCGKSDFICDNYTRCVPFDKLCKGISYCDDQTDIRRPCSGGPAPVPQVIETGVGGLTVFVLCVMMLTLGIVATLYGPDVFRIVESRFRSGQYTTFTSTE